MGLSFSVEKDGDVLMYKTYGHGYSLETVQKIKPSPEEWKKFCRLSEDFRIGHAKHVVFRCLDPHEHMAKPSIPLSQCKTSLFQLLGDKDTKGAFAKI